MCVCSVSVGGLRKGVPLICHDCFSLSPVWSGGSWTTLASDISDCCYVTSKLSRGGMYTFRTACVSKAGMGPYSSPSDQVLLGGLNHLGKLLGWIGQRRVAIRSGIDTLLPMDDLPACIQHSELTLPGNPSIFLSPFTHQLLPCVTPGVDHG